MKLTRAQFLRVAPFLAPLAGNAPPLTGKSNEAPALIPWPKNLQLSEGVFRHSGTIAFNVPASADFNAQSVRLVLSGVQLVEHRSPMPADDGLRLILEDPGAATDAPEAYMLLVENQRITVKSRSSTGLRMGLRTHAQS